MNIHEGKGQVSLVTLKPDFDECQRQRRRLACTFVQSTQHICY